MSNTLTQGPRTGEFILSEANGHRSRENGVVKSGRNLLAGTVVQFDAGKLVAFTAVDDSNGTLVTEACGILIGNIDATSADVEAAYVARHAEVKTDYLAYPAETTGGSELAHTRASLALLGIICR